MRQAHNIVCYQFQPLTKYGQFVTVYDTCGNSIQTANFEGILSQLVGAIDVPRHICHH